jgi:hypothetical protein
MWLSLVAGGGNIAFAAGVVTMVNYYWSYVMMHPIENTIVATRAKALSWA